MGVTAGHVLTSDATGLGSWQTVPPLPLPYSGTGYTSDAALEVTNGSDGLAAKFVRLSGHDIVEVGMDVWYENALRLGSSGQTAWISGGTSTTRGDLTIDHDTGDVGIGIDPLSKLHVDGTIRATDVMLTNSPAAGYVLTSDASGVGTWQPAVAGSDGDWVMSGSNLYTGVSGKVGIGTSAPAVKLDVEGPARIKGVSWPSTGAGMELAYSSGSKKGYVQVYDRGAGEWGELYLGNGMVGIGTGYPDVQLDLYSTTLDAIQAVSTVGTAVEASGFDIGVYGGGATGVHGEGGSIGVYGTSAVNAGWFDGNVQILGNTSTSGWMNVGSNLTVGGTLSKAAGMFKIDHPLDPEKRYLCHSFVESPDMMNIYNGNVVLDESGEAWIGMPDWFEALNMEFRYQLTCIGEHAPVYIAEEISENRFKIAGGDEVLKVSWQVTGVRHDDYAEANRIEVELDKE